MDSFCEKPLPPPHPQERKTCSTNVCSMLSRSHLGFLPEFVAILPNIAGKAAPSSSKSAGAGRCPGSSGGSVTRRTRRTWERRYFQRRMFHPLRSGRLGRLANKYVNNIVWQPSLGRGSSHHWSLQGLWLQHVGLTGGLPRFHPSVSSVCPHAKCT